MALYASFAIWHCVVVVAAVLRWLFFQKLAICTTCVNMHNEFYTAAWFQTSQPGTIEYFTQASKLMICHTFRSG